MLINAKTV